MALSSRIRGHLRTHIVGYLALFVALSGTALALPGNKSVKGDDLANGAVKKRALATGAVVSGKLGGGAVTADKLALGAVGPTQLADDAVERRAIKAQAVTSSKIADGAVSAEKVADSSLLADDFAAGQISDAFVTTAAAPQPFTIQRSGRIYVTATALTDCSTAPCAYGVLIDGAPVTGALLLLTQTAVEKQVTLVGLSDPITAGQHQITMSQAGAVTLSNVRVGGVLIQ